MSNVGKPDAVQVPAATLLDEKGASEERAERLEATSSTYENVAIDPEVDKRLTRKFDRHVVPWLFGMWLLAFIDRSNIGNARIDGMATDLKLDANKFNIALAVFYVPYIIIDVGI
jgi:hypothetical protein